ncbi:hypothetical protein [Verrucomicrobium sp. BvORR034]|uniref:hypothetical protein n=1 Tax=Verrucomicrobium sp. BvORR034 TaxID=1396418 RepID=UPI002241028E|nr:hypothetical protein [Verrucomicrobium sp. BvORR034]
MLKPIISKETQDLAAIAHYAERSYRLKMRVLTVIGVLVGLWVLGVATLFILGLGLFGLGAAATGAAISGIAEAAEKANKESTFVPPPPPQFNFPPSNRRAELTITDPQKAKTGSSVQPVQTRRSGPPDMARYLTPIVDPAKPVTEEEKAKARLELQRSIGK